MSAIEAYIKSVEELLTSLPSKLSSTLKLENRGDIALYIKAEIVFTDRSELHAREYFTTLPGFNKIAYSYHYQNNKKELIFRYDNAEHHPEISTYPHHKHLLDTVVSSKKPSFKETIDEILLFLYKSKKLFN